MVLFAFGVKAVYPRFCLLVVARRERAMTMLGKFKGWLEQLGNSGHRVSENRREQQMRTRQLCTKCICLCCPRCLEIASKCRFLPTEQPQELKTTRIKHEPS